MSTKQITGTVRNADGGMAPFSGTISIAGIPVINSVTVTPQSAVVGTPRIIRVLATDPDGLALTYECSVDGVALVQSATLGEFSWNG